MNPKILGAAVIAASVVASPVMAQQQQVTPNPSRCINCQKHPRAGYTNTANHHRRTAYRRVRPNRVVEQPAYRVAEPAYRVVGPPYRTGFWPADVAAGIVGGAIGTAGAIATAPFRAADAFARSNAYAWDNGYYGPYGWNNSYAARNGFVCTPGTYFLGTDGRQYLCQ